VVRDWCRANHRIERYAVIGLLSRTEKMIRFLGILCLFSAVLVAQINPAHAKAISDADVLTGTFVFAFSDDEGQPFVRITRDDWKYSVSLHERDRAEWTKSTDTAQLLRSRDFKSDDDTVRYFVRKVPFPDSLRDLPEGTLCLLVDKIDRVDQGYGSYAFFYIPKDFEFGNWGRSERLPAGYYFFSDLGAVIYLKKE
jgi:hypothetical protein